MGKRNVVVIEKCWSVYFNVDNVVSCGISVVNIKQRVLNHINSVSLSLNLLLLDLKITMSPLEIV